MPPLKTLYMLHVRLAADGEARSLEPSHAEVNSIERHDFDSLFAKVIDEPGEAEHSLWNLGPELCFSGEDDDRFDCSGRQEIKEVLHRMNVPKILQKWVLEPELQLEQDLSPVPLRRVGEEPALVVLGLDDEYAESRDKDVINLGCTVLHPKGDVIHQVIVRRIKGFQNDPGQQRLATVLECGNSVGMVAANDESNRKCKENVEKGPVVLLPAMEKLR